MKKQGIIVGLMMMMLMMVSFNADAASHLKKHRKGHPARVHVMAPRLFVPPPPIGVVIIQPTHGGHYYKQAPVRHHRYRHDYDRHHHSKYGNKGPKKHYRR
jgi:hypothetical protein